LLTVGSAYCVAQLTETSKDVSQLSEAGEENIAEVCFDFICRLMSQYDDACQSKGRIKYLDECNDECQAGYCTMYQLLEQAYRSSSV